MALTEQGQSSLHGGPRPDDRGAVQGPFSIWSCEVTEGIRWRFYPGKAPSADAAQGVCERRARERSPYPPI